MKEILKKALKGKTIKTMALSLCLMTLTAPMAFASGTGSSASSGITTAMEGVKTEFESTVAGVAPIAIGIVAIFLVWKYGLRFFKSITGGGSGN